MQTLSEYDALAKKLISGCIVEIVTIMLKGCLGFFAASSTAVSRLPLRLVRVSCQGTCFQILFICFCQGHNSNPTDADRRVGTRGSPRRLL